MRILIAEDDTVSRLILQKCVVKLGHDCVVAKDGDEAWAKCQTEQVDVVISDWMMPGLDGPELCRRIRKQESDQDRYVYIILLTSLEGRQHFLGGMQAGADDYLLKPMDKEDLQVRLVSAERVTSLHRHLADQKAELERLNAQLYEEGRTDALTRLRNRLSMQEDLRNLHDQSRRYGRGYAAALCDIDRYKIYNDRYGHQAGDDVLRKVAHSLATVSRASDTVYRYGGEEFLVLLPEQDLATAGRAMQRLSQAVAELCIPHEGSEKGIVTISVGVAALQPREPKSIDALIKEADLALYHAKESGRNCVVLHHEGQNALYQVTTERAGV
ncbi:MAG TPA: diguanylate cyclase [Oscillatoriaceae cyanobacterium]